jgi:hypothetical protein
MVLFLCWELGIRLERLYIKNDRFFEYKLKVRPKPFKLTHKKFLVNFYR